MSVDSRLEDAAAAATTATQQLEAVSDDVRETLAAAHVELHGVVPDAGLASEEVAAAVDEVLGGGVAGRLAADATAASEVLAARPAVRVGWSERSAQVAVLQRYVADAGVIAASVENHVTALAAGVAQVFLDGARAGYEASTVALDEAIAAAHVALAESEGRTLDDSREVLVAAIDAATAAREVAVDREDGDALTAGAADLNGHVEALNAAVGVVGEATAAWQAEQDRVAAEQAAAAASAAQQKSASASGSKSTTGRSGGGVCVRRQDRGLSAVDGWFGYVGRFRRRRTVGRGGPGECAGPVLRGGSVRQLVVGAVLTRGSHVEVVVR